MKISVYSLALFVGLLAGFGLGEVEKADIVVVEGEYMVRDQPSEARGVRQYLENVTRCLEAFGVRYDKSKDSEVEKGVLSGYKFAIFPYNSVMSEEEIRAIERFVDAGGKLLMFYGIPRRIYELLGIESAEYRPQEYEGQFSLIKFKSGVIEGLPEKVVQSSWNIQVPKLAPEAHILAEWYDVKGKATGYPAVVASKNGVYMSHVLLGGDWENRSWFILAAVGHFLPEVWKEAVRNAIGNIGKVSVYKSLEELEREIQERKSAGAIVFDSERRLRKAKELRQKSERLFKQKKYSEAIKMALEGQKAGKSVYYPLFPSKGSEFRAVWIHTAYGVQDWGWEKSIKVLKENGFNAILPNMFWAGLAHYESEVLPVAESVKTKGDQIAECLKWCKKYGVELHPWKVNYNLSTAPKEFIERLRVEGRTQKGQKGEDIDWLCPSHPDNFKLEFDSMLEVVRKYEVEGIHFDYIRYPGPNSCYCEGCKERFQKETGITVEKWPEDVLVGGKYVDQFQDWRRDQITRLVKAVSEEARKIKPEIKISAAVFSDWKNARVSVGQDWKLWVEKGYLDFVCPMDYTANIEQLERLVKWQVDWVDGRIPLYIGIGAWLLGGADQLLDQVQLSRNLGADGFVLFHYDDLTIANEFLPAMKEGITKTKAVMPHNVPKVNFEYPRAMDEFEGLCYLENSEVVISVTLTKEANLAKKVTAASGEISLETLEAKKVKDFKPIRIFVDKLVPVKLRFPEGLYRVVLSGMMTFEDKTRQPFVAKSRFIRMISQKAIEELKAKKGPPKVEGPGLRVGIWHNGYGSQPILEVLKEVEGLNPFFIYNFNMPTLEVCQVLIIPQLKTPEEMDKEARERIRKWVEGGGRLLVTHDAVGYRFHRPIIEEVCKKGISNVNRRKCKVIQVHPVTAGLNVGEEFEHSYYDHITLESGEAGRVLVVDSLDNSAILVVGEFGRGRYVANGMVTGLTEGDENIRPVGAELKLLVNAVKWLGQP